MRKRFLSALSGLLLLATCGLVQAKVLVVTPSNSGSPESKINLTTETSIKFSEKTFNVFATYDANPVTFAYTDVRTITFGEGTPDVAIQKPEHAMSLRLVQNPVRDLLRINGHDGSRTQLRIVAMNGATVFSSPWQGEDLDVSALRTGFYLLVINSQAIKFIKQ
ncbi:MAG: T9SS type A sorting domain-containing protein [Bacteroides sp.]|nr:T9SS type A sorting domain-containing protein [Bacteroides sp.]MCM1086047.1 T9SS type A sorting domain-containing protein [Bacteroides sp.]MCM1170135.1 T9SS type A sorting domain-containing protein [Bacteroides sp.]